MVQGKLMQDDSRADIEPRGQELLQGKNGFYLGAFFVQEPVRAHIEQQLSIYHFIEHAIGHDTHIRISLPDNREFFNHIDIRKLKVQHQVREGLLS